MLRIGEFSLLTGISIHMLRHYDKIGLLIPVLIDQTSGYRYYSEKQIVDANQILVLKKLGFGLKEIASIQGDGDNTDNVIAFVNRKIEEKKQELIKTEDQILRMQRAVVDLADEQECALAVTVKKLPARKVVSLRGSIKSFEDEGQLWASLTNECKRLHIKLSAVDYAYAVTHHIDMDKSLIDVEVQRVVDRLEKDTDIIKFNEVSECDVAAVAFEGLYNKLSSINGYIANWVYRNQYRLCANVFSIYYKSPENEQNPDRYITEVCFPIKKA